MRPIRRFRVSKGRSAGHFRSNVSRTHPLNVKVVPMRGGFRI